MPEPAAEGDARRLLVRRCYLNLNWYQAYRHAFLRAGFEIVDCPPVTSRWGDVPLADYTMVALRAGIAWVPQEAFLFSASVAENIALARPDATRAQIEAAARQAAVHDDIQRLPQGYDTPVGERGVTLSGGQRQRVAIARALLADAPLLCWTTRSRRWTPAPKRRSWPRCARRARAAR